MVPVDTVISNGGNASQASAARSPASSTSGARRAPAGASPATRSRNTAAAATNAASTASASPPVTESQIVLTGAIERQRRV